MNTTQNPTAAQRARTTWSSGDYTEVADRLIPGFGPVLVEAAGIQAGQRVLDVACGAGNVAIPAAVTGADVTGLDITPELLRHAAERAAETGVAVDWVEGDAEHLPFADASFDTVVSAVGVMFCPDHERTAAELLRVCRPGGTIGLIAWTPEGLIGRMFGVVGPYAPPPPAGARPGVLWGSEAHVQTLLGDQVSELHSERRLNRFDGLTPDGFVDLMRQRYGPVVGIFARVAEDEERTAALDAGLRAFAHEQYQGGSDGPALDAEYLLTVARRA